MTLLPQQRGAEVVVRLARIRLQANGLRAQPDRLVELALLEAKDGDELQQVGVARLSRQNLARELLGLVELSALEQRERVVQQELACR
jgi:hypothetical protein